MADYQPLIARAVGGLENNTGEARRALYERARAALVAQLRSIDPPLSEADITRERLALEDAVRKVEAESVRKSRLERPTIPRPTTTPRATPQPAAAPPPAAMPPRREPVPAKPSFPARPEPVALPESPSPPRIEPPPLAMQGATTAATAPRPAAPDSARGRILSARTSPVSRDGLKSLRDAVQDADGLGAASAKSAQSARDTRDSYGGAQPDADDLAPFEERSRPRFGDALEQGAEDETLLHDRSPAADYDDEPPLPPYIGRQAHEAEPQEREPRPPRSYQGLARLAVLLIILAGVVATVSWQWSNIAGLYHAVSNMRGRPAPTAQAPAPTPKFSGRVPQEQSTEQAAPAPGVAPSTTPGATPGQSAVPVAQRVVLYEEDANNPQGRQFVGSAVWRTETVSPGSGLAPELEVRADITIPEKNMTVTWTLRRNTDQALPASHTIEIMFNLPKDFAGGGIANVPGVLMKDSEQARGVPLAGLAVKVTNGFFLIGLSSVQADVERNVQLLKDRPWFDIPIVYTNGGRAILALEKGPPGDRAFADAFAAWGK